MVCDGEREERGGQCSEEYHLDRDSVKRGVISMLLHDCTGSLTTYGMLGSLICLSSTLLGSRVAKATAERAQTLAKNFIVVVVCVVEFEESS